MSAIVYAKIVHCDWPGCQSVGDTKMDVPGNRHLPAGWLDLRTPLDIRTVCGVPLGELCTLHEGATISQFVKAFTPARPEETSEPRT